MLDEIRLDEEEDEEEDEEKEEKEPRDPFAAKLLKTRTILLSDGIDKRLAHKVITQLLLLHRRELNRDGHLLSYAHFTPWRLSALSGCLLFTRTLLDGLHPTRRPA